MVEIDNKLYQYSKSNNNQYMVAWRDDDEESLSGRGGSRSRGHGRIILIRNEHKVYDSLSFERPKRAKVTNNGMVIILDLLFGACCKGQVSIVNSEGEIVFSHRVRKSLNTDNFSYGISTDEKYAWFSTYLYSGYIVDLPSRTIVRRGNNILNLSGVYIDEANKVQATYQH
ncbi:MAG: hypothetical protein JXK05_03880 [Campylobacterales bacterium]|nr:hypothetical protein [Campylobacterales bacterium]